MDKTYALLLETEKKHVTLCRINRKIRIKRFNYLRKNALSQLRKFPETKCINLSKEKNEIILNEIRQSVSYHVFFLVRRMLVLTPICLPKL